MQLCAGQQAGCEAAVHAMTEIFEHDDTDAILLVDAANAFNSINRKVLLHNIRYICPTIATYTINCYSTSSRVFVQGGRELNSAEGTTQGDTISMPIYAMGITPLLSSIKKDNQDTKHAAFADDLCGGGRLRMLRVWWDSIVENGPLLGYYPRADKSWLVVKEELLTEANEIFANSNVQITTEGHKYLGGFMGSQEGRNGYAVKLVQKWIEQIRALANIAKTEPQAAYAAFVSGFKHRLTYHIRTMSNLATPLKQLDDVITFELIPSITDGRNVSETERQLLSLPVRLGGLGIPIFAEQCAIDLQNSKNICEKQTQAIINQNNIESDLTIAMSPATAVRSNVIKERDELHRIKLELVRSSLNAEQKRANDVAQLKGASNWLSALPLEEEGYVLNKRQFIDALSLRYRWELKWLPATCACGHKFTVDHAVILSEGRIHTPPS